MSSDSSDDEENLKLLREAADHQFINDSMFSGKNQWKKDASTELPRSLRPSKQDDQFNTLGVTPEFQAHVARCLATNLEKRLKHVLAPDVDTNVSKTHRNNNSGIKLLKDSKYFIENECETDIASASVNKRRRLKTDDSNDDEIRFKAAAVTPEHVLNKIDTIHWSNRSKAQVFRYRKTKGGLLISADVLN